VTMSYQAPEDQQTYLPLPAPRRRRRTWVAVGAGAVAMAAVMAVLIPVLAGGVHRTGAAGTPSEEPATSTTTVTTSTYEHTAYVPQPADFVLEVQVIEQQCFGSAGCNVTFRLGVTYTGDTIYDDEGPYTVVYNITGSDGPFIGRFTLLSQYEFSASEEFVSTPPGATLTATVTQVY